MTEDELKLFRGYVEYRRDLYSWTKFWTVMIPVFIVVTVALCWGFQILWGLE